MHYIIFGSLIATAPHGETPSHHQPPITDASELLRYRCCSPRSPALSQNHLVACPPTDTLPGVIMEPIKLLNRPPITYSAALDTDTNTIHEVQYDRTTRKFCDELWSEEPTIAALVRHHLGLGDQDACIVDPPSRWIRGGFNICIPVQTESAGLCRKLILRCAMPHKLAEARYPGTVDEKMGCEIGAYVWIQEKCPDIRIPHLYGFGFLDHHHVYVSPPSFIDINSLASYSSHTRYTVPYTSGFDIISGTFSATFSDTRPSSRTTRSIQAIFACLRHTCCWNMSVQTPAGCSRLRGADSGKMRPVDGDCLRAWPV